MRVFYKFIDKLNWLAMQERFEILEESMKYIKTHRSNSLMDQNDHVEDVLSLARK
jgi:hypothetical protein